MSFKGSNGVWEVNPRATRNVRCGNKTIANCSSGQNGNNEEEEIANAELIADAGTTTSKCQKSPSQLLKENITMQNLLEAIYHTIDDRYSLVKKHIKETVTKFNQ